MMKQLCAALIVCLSVTHISIYAWSEAVGRDPAAVFMGSAYSAQVQSPQEIEQLFNQQQEFLGPMSIFSHEEAVPLKSKLIKLAGDSCLLFCVSLFNTCEKAPEKRTKWQTFWKRANCVICVGSGIICVWSLWRLRTLE